MKVLVFILSLLSLNALAEEVIKIEYPFDFSGVLLEQPKMSKVKGASFIVNKHIQENYNQDNQFFCGGVYMLTPDQELKNAYESGIVKVVSEFGYTKNFKAYTPIRQLVKNPDKNAVFNGYYFVSSNR
tara:strand:- start:54 stop:437 length:384 start_codon:yes stop_codon:yes gene_type:complete